MADLTKDYGPKMTVAPFHATLLYAVRSMASARAICRAPEALAAGLLADEIAKALDLSSTFDELDERRTDRLGGVRPKSSARSVRRTVSEAERLAAESGEAHLTSDKMWCFLSCVLAEHCVDLEEAQDRVEQELVWRSKTRGTA